MVSRDRTDHCDPDAVWSMNSRAVAATGTDATGADFKSISDLLTHSEPRTTVRYIRNTSKKMRTLAKARAQTRDGVAMPERCRNGPSERPRDRSKG